MGWVMGARAEIACNVKAIAAVRPTTSRIVYRIKGERGLLLAVYPTGKKTWQVKYQLGNGAARKQRTREIGDVNYVTLAEARAKKSALLAKAARGEDPDSPETFGALFYLWLESHAKRKLATWRDEERRYAMHLAKPLGARLISKIERKDVREIRDVVLEKSGPIQSNRVVALFNRVMNWAVDEDRAKFNPAARLSKVGEEKRRERILTNDELARLWLELDRPLAVDLKNGGLNHADLAATEVTRRALKLLVLTGQRRGEVIGMRKDELNLAEGDAWWSLPADRTKNKLPHRVPLTKMAVAVIREAIDASGSSDFVFPSRRTDNAIMPDAVTKSLQRLCRRMIPKIEGLGPHDIRRTVGTTLRKLGVTVEDRSYLFNHVSGAKSKVTSWNYDPGEHDEEKRSAIHKWEQELRRIVGLDSCNVVELKRGGGATRQR